MGDKQTCVTHIALERVPFHIEAKSHVGCSAAFQDYHNNKITSFQDYSVVRKILSLLIIIFAFTGEYAENETGMMLNFYALR